MIRLALAIVLAWPLVAAAEELVPIPLEVSPPVPGLPAMPSFDPSEPDVFTVEELRAWPPKRGTQLELHGYVLWIYDCAIAIAQPRESRVDTLKRIDDKPELCASARILLGASPIDLVDDGRLVIDLPRPPTKLERKTVAMEDLRDWPKVPALRVGDYVAVTGKLDADGNVVFKRIAFAPRTPRVSRLPLPPLAIAAVGKMNTPVNPSNAESIRLTKRASDDLQPAYSASALLQQAIKLWPGNHVARYRLAQISLAAHNPSEAKHQLEAVVKFEPESAMYRVAYGQASYEAAIEELRQATASAFDLKPADVKPDYAAVKAGDAISNLAFAIDREPRLWRAHYQLGRIHFDRGDIVWAAREFDQAARNGATDAAVWIAYADMLRRWRYTDEALAVAKAGIAITQSADLWYSLGMAYLDKGATKQAIDAFDHSIGLGNTKALFQRGRLKRAKADLERFARQPLSDVMKQQVTKMLMDMSPKQK